MSEGNNKISIRLTYPGEDREIGDNIPAILCSRPLKITAALCDIHTERNEDYVGRFAFLVYFSRNPPVSCCYHWSVFGNAKPVLQGFDGR